MFLGLHSSVLWPVLDLRKTWISSSAPGIILIIFPLTVGDLRLMGMSVFNNFEEYSFLTKDALYFSHHLIMTPNPCQTADIIEFWWTKRGHLLLWGNSHIVGPSGSFILYKPPVIEFERSKVMPSFSPDHFLRHLAIYVVFMYVCI